MKGDNLFKNFANGVLQHVQKPFLNPFKKVGFSWLTLRLLRNLPAYKKHTVKFLDHRVSFFSRPEFLHSVTEIFIEEIYKQQLRPHAYIIDCGANIGLSVIYLKKLFPDAELIAFEPDDFNFKLLRENVEGFGFTNVTLRKEAVWTSNTKLNFSNESSQMSRISDREGSNAVDAIRLKDLLNREIDFLKIDIEGAEFEVMKDIEDSLSHVQNLFVEYHGTFAKNSELEEILGIVTRSGFTYYLKTAADKHRTPFARQHSADYDVQLNIFCFRE